MENDKRLIKWKSSFCACKASLTVDGEVFTAEACDANHATWSERVGKDQTEIRRSEMRDFQRNEYPQKLQMYLNNLGDGKTKLFRPLLLPKNAELSAEQAMWDLECSGVEPLECAAPEKLADYIQGKSLLGLLLEDLKEKYYKFITTDPKYSFDQFLFWGEEFLAAGMLTESMYKSIYFRKSEPALVNFFKQQQVDKATKSIQYRRIPYDVDFHVDV